MSQFDHNQGSILLTGGTGYIGSHTLVELLEASYQVIIIDNLSNSNVESIERVQKITGKQQLKFYHQDLLDDKQLNKVFATHPINGVIHLAGLKAVGESVTESVKYYHNNLGSTLNLLNAMKRHQVTNMVFSSSATIYGDPCYLPIDEQHQRQYGYKATNPYGETKAMIEKILTDATQSDYPWNFISLRYFNPIGAHKSGLIGEDPKGIPNNLNPYILRVVSGLLPKLTIYGEDYDTKDGTGVRDYIHVQDLANSHVKALEYLMEHQVGHQAVNIGTGKGYSVKEVLQCYEDCLGQALPKEIGQRRAGDIGSIFANPSLAQSKLSWVAKRELKEMVADSLRWAQNNPNGYSEAQHP